MTRLPFSVPRRLLLAAVAGLFAAVAGHTGVFRAFDTLVYDSHLANWGHEPDGHTLIVAIDDRSIAELGQWPWPRSVHARLIDRLHAAGARAVALDLVLSEPGQTGDADDAALAQAMQRYGRVVLPVVASSPEQNGPLEELLPIPAFAKVAAGLGHTDLAPDEDGRARSLVLRAGLDSAYWPSLPEALLSVAQPRSASASASSESVAASAGPFWWQRGDRGLLRFAGPPDTYPRVSYLDALEGRIPDDLLRDRLVIVGVTAPGLAAQLFTPMSRAVPMAGAEYLANALDTLRLGGAMHAASAAWQATVSALAVLACIGFGFGLGGGLQRAVYSCLVPAMIAIAASLSILRLCGIWFAPGAIVGTLALCAVLVGIAHLRHWRRQAHRDTLTGLPNRREFTSTLQRELAATARDGDPITLTLVDIDHFKQFNDTAGHARGDRLLVRVARLLEGVLVRPRELAVRLGGDEFALILPEIGVERAREVAQRLQADMRTMTSQFESAGLPMPTLTIGIATRTPGSKTGADELFEQADSALYRAKRRGRDRVIIADESP